MESRNEIERRGHREAVARDTFINAMRRVPSNVTVVTTEGCTGRHGATVSAFCSVSADPPSVLVCLNASSRISRLVTHNRKFCVNILTENQTDVAEQFAGHLDEVLTDRFCGLDCLFSGTTSLPVIKGSTAFECELHHVLDFASHRIFIGHPVCVHTGSNRPLAYLNGAYQRMVPKNGVRKTVGIR